MIQLAKILFEQYAKNNILNILVDTNKSTVAEDISPLGTEINHLKENINDTHSKPNVQSQDCLRSLIRKFFKHTTMKKNQLHKFKFKLHPQFRNRSW